MDKLKINRDRLRYPKFNSKGEAFFSYVPTNSIYKAIPPYDNLELFVGNTDNKFGSYKDGKGTEVEFNQPTGLSFDAQDNLYVSDTGNNAIRKITPDGIVSTFYKHQ